MQDQEASFRTSSNYDRISKGTNLHVLLLYAGFMFKFSNSLQGVVVVEDILRAKEVLALKNQDPVIIVDELKKLEPKVPGVDLLRTTKLGKNPNKNMPKILL